MGTVVEGRSPESLIFIDSTPSRSLHPNRFFLTYLNFLLETETLDAAYLIQLIVIGTLTNSYVFFVIDRNLDINQLIGIGTLNQLIVIGTLTQSIVIETLTQFAN